MAKNHELWYTGEGRGRGRPREMPLRGKDSDRKHFIVAPGLQKGTTMHYTNVKSPITDELLGYVQYNYCTRCGGLASLGRVQGRKNVQYEHDNDTVAFAPVYDVRGKKIGLATYYHVANHLIVHTNQGVVWFAENECACEETHND